MLHAIAWLMNWALYIAGGIFIVAILTISLFDPAPKGAKKYDYLHNVNSANTKEEV